MGEDVNGGRRCFGCSVAPWSKSCWQQFLKISKWLMQRIPDLPQRRRWPLSEVTNMTVTLSGSLCMIYMCWNVTLDPVCMCNYYVLVKNESIQYVSPQTKQNKTKLNKIWVGLELMIPFAEITTVSPLSSLNISKREEEEEKKKPLNCNSNTLWQVMASGQTDNIPPTKLWAQLL